jgi:zinc transporter, ZIP family
LVLSSRCGRRASLLAGLSTGIGGLIAFFAKHTNTKFLSTSLGFSAGVMIYISMVELLPDAKKLLMESLGSGSNWIAVTAFFGGICIAALIDWLIPSTDNMHEVHRVEEMNSDNAKQKLFRLGIFSTLAITIHNFPEGMATFVSALHDSKVGISIAIAVGLHNIPEGISVSVPVYFATHSRKKALFFSFLSGLAEPLGAIIGYMFLSRFLNGTVMAILFAAVAGIMVFISFDELLPSAHEYGEHHLAVYGLISGMMLMAFGLLLF